MRDKLIANATSMRNSSSVFPATSSRIIRLVICQIICGLILVVGLGSARGASATNRVIKRLSLDDCIRLGLDHSLKVQIARDSSIIARYTLQATNGLYDPV